MKNWIKIIIEIYLLLLVIALSYFIGAVSGDWLQQKQIENILKDNFNEKNLSFVDEEQLFIHRYYSQEDFETYYNYFQQNYNYEKNKTDCKFYAFNWGAYFYKHNINYKYINTDKHIMVLAYNDEGYCLISNNNTFCEGMKLN